MSDQTPTSVTRLRDPVCGMSVRLDAAQVDGLAIDHHGTLYAFCRESCRDSFLSDPHRYTGAAAVVSDSVRTDLLPVIDDGMRKWYDSCSCCLGDAYPQVKAALDEERRQQTQEPAGQGICEVAEAAEAAEQRLSHPTGTD